MSNALPMALLRPSCAALRPSAPITHQWSSVTLAFARRFCSPASSSTSHSKHGPSLLSIIQSHNFPIADRHLRSFSSTSRTPAKVEPDSQPAKKTRVVNIPQLPNGDVSKSAVKRIFNSDLSSRDGNDILRILHHRRTSGSLADYGVDNLGSRFHHISRTRATKALEWLRTTFPVDEARAAEEWAEKEANRIAYELWLADPENADSKYNDPARVWAEQQAEMEQEKEGKEKQIGEGQRIGLLRVGPSEFERNIEMKRKERLEAATRKAEEKERKEKEDEVKLATGEYVRTPSGTQLMKPGQTTYVDIFGREQVSMRKEVMEYYQKKAQTPFKDEQEMLKATTLVQRLYPMTAFVLITCLLSFGFAYYYIPPSPSYRLWPDLSHTTATIAAIIGTNILICALWRWTPLWPFMTRYFMHAPGYPRAVQSVLNVFSHVQYEHLLANMMFFALVGTVCHDLVGRGIFFGTYLSAGAVGTLFSLYWANLGRGMIAAHSVGASAAIWGISALYLSLTDTEKIKLPFLKDKEVTFWPKMLFAALLLFEIRNALRKKGTTMDHASHFGGMLTGASVAGYLRYRGFHERRAEVVGADGVKDGEQKMVDVEALVKEEVREVKEGVMKVVPRVNEK